MARVTTCVTPSVTVTPNVTYPVTPRDVTTPPYRGVTCHASRDGVWVGSAAHDDPRHAGRVEPVARLQEGREHNNDAKKGRIMTDANPARARKSHIYAREEGDHYVEPLWLGEALFRRLLLPAGTVVLDPACGWGRMLRGAAKQGLIALGSDIAPRWDESPDGPLPQGAISFHQADWFAPDFNENTPGAPGASPTSSPPTRRSTGSRNSLSSPSRAQRTWSRSWFRRVSSGARNGPSACSRRPRSLSSCRSSRARPCRRGARSSPVKR